MSGGEISRDDIAVTTDSREIRSLVMDAGLVPFDAVEAGSRTPGGGYEQPTPASEAPSAPEEPTAPPDS